MEPGPLLKLIYDLMVRTIALEQRNAELEEQNAQLSAGTNGAPSVFEPTLPVSEST